MHPWEEHKWLPGVLSKGQMKVLMLQRYVTGIPDFDRAADHSSIDLHLSEQAYKIIPGSLKPSGPYHQFLSDSNLAVPLELDDGCFKLESNKCYVFKLKETLTPKLRDTPIYGQATAKSSVGRVDVIARLIVDGMWEYDSIDPKCLADSSGEMFLEIIPITFNVRVKAGVSLSQLRFFYGDIDSAIIKEDNFIKCVLHGSSDGKGYLSVDLTPVDISGHQVTAFQADDSDAEDDYIDLWTKEDEQKPDPCKYWRFVNADQSERLQLTNDDFYLLRSKERIALPSGVAVYCRAMDETLGEMRIHYAGFVHPHFGHHRTDRQGTPLIFEVRAHNVDVSLADGERLARLVFYRMSETADEELREGDEYSTQELNLSKFFQKWPNDMAVDEDGKVTIPA